MDSAYSKHMTKDKGKFLSFSEGSGGKVVFGGGKKETITGVGSIGKFEDTAIERIYPVKD